MSDKINQGQSKASSKGKGNGIAQEVILVVMIVFVVGLIAFSVGYEAGGKSMFLIASGDGVQDVQVSVPNSQSQEGAPSVADTSPVIALVDGERVTRNEVFELVNSMPQQMQQLPSDQLIPLAIEQVINNKLVTKKAAGSGLANDPEVQKQLANIREQLVRAKYIEIQVNNGLTDARLKEAYGEYVKNFPEVEEVKAAHILVDDEAKAKEIITKLNGGAEFAALAKEYSKDGTAENGGDLGYFAQADVVPEFSKAAFSTDKGSYTKTPVKSNFGYHIIKVEDKRIRPTPDFVTAKPYLEQELRRTILDEIVMKWREEADIERFDINGNPIKAVSEGDKPDEKAEANLAAPDQQEPAAGEGEPEQEKAAE